MRNCPHCNREIQDEAVFCRFCRQDVDPPLWLSSLQKCPFCAEWVERGIERCPLCSRDISSSIPFSQQETPEEASESLLSRITGQSEGEAPSPETDDTEMDSEPLPSEPIQDSTPSSVFDAPDSQPYEDAGLAAIHERRLSPDSDFDPLAELRPAEDEEDGDQGRVPSIPSRFIKLGAVAIGIVVVLIIAAVVVQNIVLPNLGSGDTDDLPQGTATTSTRVKPTSTELPGAIATSTGVRLPTTTPEITCLEWDSVTLDQSGQTLCVSGTLKRWFRVSADMPYMAIFSEDTGAFAIADRTQTYNEFLPGDCIQVEGTVEVMRGIRPFIDAQGTLQACEES